MKKSTLLLLGFLLILCGQISAQTVSVADAKAKAVAFLSNGAKKLPAKNGVKRVAPKVQNVELAYTSEKDGKTCFYVFNNGTDGGFVIVGGDDAAKEILAYSDKGHFDYDKAPDNFKGWLSQYTEQISLAKPVTQSKANKVASKVAGSTVQKEDIADLITTTWNQTDPYNRAIPKLVSSTDGTEYAPPTGCVPTAVAQIMKYWNYPEHGTGQETRTLDYSQINGYNPGNANYTPEFGTVTHNINFEETTYDWANMLDNYTGDETEEQIKAVSTLMYHVGIACQAVYGVNETTGANPEEGLKKYFGYSQKAQEIQRDEFDDQTWEEIIYSELKLGRPVLYSGVGSGYDGHEYIIHGYSAENDMYRVNWGWGGFCDCYCTLTPSSGSTLMGYENNQTAVVKLQPATKDSDAILDYGDTFWADGLKYSILSKIFNTVTVECPSEEETMYSGDIEVPSEISYNGETYKVVHVSEYAFSIWYKKDSGVSGTRPSEITSVKFNDNMRSLGPNVFNGESTVTNIELPNSIIKISDGCFSNCSSLTSLNLPDNIQTIPAGAINSCYNLESLVFPDNLRVIESNGCSFNTRLKEVTLPASLDSIGTWAFYGDRFLYSWTCLAVEPPALEETSCTFPSICSCATLFVPKESIQKYKDAECWSRFGTILPYEEKDNYETDTQVTIDNIDEYRLTPNGAVITEGNSGELKDSITYNGKKYPVIAIGECAFAGRPFSSIKLPQTIKYIFDEAFNSSSIHKLILPESLKEIYSAAMTDMTTIFSYSKTPPTVPNLRTYPSDNMVLVVPAESKTLYQEADYWKLVKNILTLDEVDEKFGDSFKVDGSQYNISVDGAHLEYACEKDTVIIPEEVQYKGTSYPVTTINEYAFHLNHVVKYIELPHSLTSISNQAFVQVDNLLRLVLKKGLKTIGNNIIAEDNKLSEFVVPEGTEEIGGWTFHGNSLKKAIIPSTIKSFSPTISANLEELYILATDLPALPDGWTPTMPSECTLYVPTESIDKYKSDSYWNLAKEIKPITPLSSMSLDKNQLELVANNTDNLQVQAYPVNASLPYVEWSSSDPTIASVNQDGVVTALKAGTATITATSMYYPELSDVCTVTVCNIGDANNDGVVNVGDLSSIVGYILNTNIVEGFNESAADANSDGDINVGDLSTIVKMILGINNSDVKSRIAPKTTAETQATMNVKSLEIKPGEDALMYVNLDNSMDVASFQFDMTLPEGFTCENVTADYRRVEENASLSYAKMNENSTRVLCYSPSNEAINGTNGNIAIIKIHADNDLQAGNYEATISGIKVANADECKNVENFQFGISVGSATGIQGVMSDNNDNTTKYDMSGRAVNKNAQGMIISNGKKYLKK